MATLYTEEILNFLQSDEDDEAFMEWVVQQKLIDQPDILREFKDLVRKGLADKGIYDMDFTDFDAQIEIYQEAILTEKLAEAELVMAQQTLDKKIEEVIEITAQVRKYVIDCIINNEENAESMKELALKLIEGEKENDVYEEKNWAAIL